MQKTVHRLCTLEFFLVGRKFSYLSCVVIDCILSCSRRVQYKSCHVIVFFSTLLIPVNECSRNTHSRTNLKEQICLLSGLHVLV